MFSSPTFISISIVYLIASFLVALTVGRHRRLGILGSMVVCLITSPMFGFFIVSASAQKNPKGCNWCGNAYNEADYCGLCGKNDQGEIRPGFVPKPNKNLLDRS